MSDELESILAESLHQRAAHADTHGRSFGEVRRRVRRHRQRQMAVGLLPAVAGLGYLVSRPIAHDPLTAGDAAGCGDTLPASTWPAWTGEATTLPPILPPDHTGTTWEGSPTSTTSVPGELTGTTYYLDGDGNVLQSSTTVPWPTLPDGSPWPADENGNPATTVFNTLPPSTYTTDANGNVLDANGLPSDTTVPYTYADATDVPGTDSGISTTMACDTTTTLPPTTSPSITLASDTTGPADTSSVTVSTVEVVDDSTTTTIEVMDSTTTSVR